MDLKGKKGWWIEIWWKPNKWNKFNNWTHVWWDVWDVWCFSSLVSSWPLSTLCGPLFLIQLTAKIVATMEGINTVVWLHWAGSWEAAAFFKDWIRSTHGMIWFTRHKPAWLNSGVQQHTRGSGVKWAKQEIREIVGWKCHWQGWSRSSSCTDSILKKKNVVQNMMLMWSQLDAQLRMNLWKSWISSPATLSKVRSTTDVVSADVDFWSSPFLWLDT